MLPEANGGAHIRRVVPNLLSLHFMETLHAIFLWFTGGVDHQYMKLAGCMKGDTLWIAITVTFDLAVATGYSLIALHWMRNGRNLPDVPAKRALSHMRNIFVFCGICGYLFIPIKMFWPAWRLYDIFMAFLVYFTWQYALGSRDLKVVYAELGRSSQLAEDLEKSQQQAKRKSFFLNAVSHDLRTPLNGMVLQSNLAEMCAENNDSEGLKQAMIDIRASVSAAAGLLDALLDYARVEMAGEQNHLSDFQLRPLLDEITTRCRAVADQKRLALSAHCNGLSLRTDRLKLDRILANLIDNAIKFTPTGQVRIETEQAGSNLEIHVIDSGIGIDPEIHNRLFEEFFQVHNHERDRNKGFGMGLAIAQRLARQLGGDICLDSSPGRGSRFSVCLPGVVTPHGGGQSTVA
jgi:signal transduction histidine kinase